MLKYPEDAASDRSIKKTRDITFNQSHIKFD